MTEEEWLNFTQLGPLIVYALDGPDVTSRQRALFGCGGCRCALGGRMPDFEARAIGAMERYHDGEITRKTWLRHHLVVGAENEAWSLAATAWQRNFRRAVQFLYTSTTEGVAEWLLHAFKSANTVQDSAAFEAKLCVLIRDIFSNPFRPVAFAPDWRTDTAVAVAKQMYDQREFSAMPILADALQDAGCDNEAILGHCRDATLTHVRGCWVVDLVLSKA